MPPIARRYRPGMTRPPYQHALARLGALERLAPFDPHVAGTPPLGLDLPSSDIDILCHAPDTEAFRSVLLEAFGSQQDFAIRDWAGPEPAIIAGFHAHGWDWEIFGQALPVARQAGWRHFKLEERLLRLGGPALLARIMTERRDGAKTEPAFATVLGLSGDPFEALLAIDHLSDDALADLIAGADQGSVASR